MGEQNNQPKSYPIPGTLEEEATMVLPKLLCAPLYHPSQAALRALDQREAAELTYWICVVGSNKAATSTLKPASRTSTRLGILRHGGVRWGVGVGGGGGAEAE